jgi:hypothetical protein
MAAQREMYERFGKDIADRSNSKVKKEYKEKEKEKTEA